MELPRKARKTIAIMSGKGGAGKSTIAGLLAASLQREYRSVGLLDGDLISPAILYLFGLEKQLVFDEQGQVEPLTSQLGIKCMAFDIFQEHESEPLVWRGPMVSSAFKQLYNDTNWGDLDYLIVDVPTGTSDIPITVLCSLPLDGIIIVSPPQQLAQAVTNRCVNMIRQYGGQIIGAVENMVHPMPSTLDHENHLPAVPLLAQIPFDAALTRCCDTSTIETYCPDFMHQLISNMQATLNNIKQGE
jgi:Mrp family chromosome partitioning ATPase